MPRTIWQLQHAKNRFSQVVNQALDQGPQVITRHGKEVAVLVSKDEFDRLQKSRSGLVAFFRDSPLVGVDLDLSRDQSRPRELLL
jgi:prevent-host-death family protein